MDANRWKIIEEIYHAALEKPAEARDSFLDSTCGHDAELRREVESLIQESSVAEEFMEPDRRPLTGRTLNHYRVESLLGAGGMAEVYRAKDTKLERDVAIKVLHRAHFLDPQRLERLYREARLLASLNHPNIASIYGLEEADGICALVLELVEGETLKERIERGAVSRGEALDIARQILAGLEAAHAKGIIHRDLKPSNIKVSPDGTVKILDFGLAKLLRPFDSQLTAFPTLSQDGLVLGTLHYMSPEQARGKDVDSRTDIWGFGCVLYELLTGRPAFQGETSTEILMKIASEEPEWSSLSGITASTVREFQPLLRKCLQKKPEARYQSAREIAADLDSILKGRKGRGPADTGTESEFILPGKSDRPLFLFAQAGYIAMYAAAMFYIDSIADHAARDFQLPESLTIAAVIFLAMCGLSVRIYLISAVGWRHPAAREKFQWLFPVIWLLDSIWAASPLLLWRGLTYGLALTCVALLAYVPFAQRTLVRSMYPRH